MFFMVATSFFIVCGVSAAQHDVYAGFSVPSTYTFTDTVTYNVGNRSYGTAAYIDINWTWADYRNFYNSKGASISVAGADFYGDIELISVSASDPTIDCSLDGNRIRIYFNSNYNGNLNITLTYACNYTWYVGTIIGSPAPADSLQDVTLRTNFTLTFGNINYYDSQSIGMGDLNSKLDQILDALGDSPLKPDFLGDDALFYIRSDYFNTTFGCSFNSDGWLNVSKWSDFGVYNWDSSNQPNYQFSPGTYLVYVMRPDGVEFDSIVFEGVNSSFYSIDSLFISSVLNPKYIFEVFLIDIKEFFTYTTLHFHYSGSAVASLPVYIGFAIAPDDFIAGEAVNPDQSGLVEDVDNAGQQQQQQEDQLWTNINSYKGDLTFNIDDWSEASGGLSYVSSIFMTIWNNSPTQVIVLSLMLGIAMLSIGRGAMAAVRVSRNRHDDD